jgi:protocatechuate 3,4-dioxygenase, alpha subunit
VSRGVTPEATIGPFYPGAFLTDTPQDLWTVAPLVAHRPAGQPLVFAARFLDALKQPVPSLVVEFWQANAHGRYRHPLDQSDRPLDPQFDGFARLRTDDAGMLRLHTIKPGAHPVRMEREALRLARPELVALRQAQGDPELAEWVEGRARSGQAAGEWPAVMRAPHLRLTIFASGIDRLVTQVFFDDEPLNASDPVLLGIPDAVVRSRLVAARRGATAGQTIEYGLDIVLRGDGETPFFDDWD